MKKILTTLGWIMGARVHYGDVTEHHIEDTDKEALMVTVM